MGFGLVLACVVLSTFASSNPDVLQSSYLKRWGAGRLVEFNDWQSVLAQTKTPSTTEKLKRVNDFFNRSIQFGEDAAVWGQPDYWATPLETMGRGAGDCEDYAIAKYFSLLEAGVDPVKLRLVYVRAKTGSANNLQIQAHMVLAYYPQADQEPLVMDNLDQDIRPASQRADLVPVFSFNRAGIYAGISTKTIAPAGGTGRLSRWEDLIRQAHAEGFE
jgi:predicted transglutaminase-like cysteine proteinase